MDVIVGTAGHIDHGKTALVKALTGVDADRLPEEKRRGITVDLGFAEMTVGDAHFGFVDVPGHERFVKNMLAGASGIDLMLLVIAADEGVMPQTREHFDICRLLDVRSGVIALTKTDLIDTETLELAKIDAAALVVGSFLENSRVIGVSSKTGAGLDELRDALVAEARALARAIDDLNSRVSPLLTRGLAQRGDLVGRLPIDRSFSMKGFGTVVTGTLASGEISEGGELELLPEGRRIRVRGLQTHGQTVTTARAGQRVAVNLAGIDTEEVTRGMMLAEPDVLKPTQGLDAEVEVLADAPKPLRSRQRVRVHIGTAEALARLHILNDTGEIAPGEKDFVQIRLEAPVVAVAGERFIIRSYSPQHTIAGGRVIDTFASRHRRKDIVEVRKLLTSLSEGFGDPAATVRVLVRAAAESGLSFSELRVRTAWKTSVLNDAIAAEISSSELVDANGRYVAAGSFERLRKATEDAIKQFHEREPLAKGAGREAIRDRSFARVPAEVFNAVLSSLESARIIVADKETVRLADHRSSLLPDEAAFSERLSAIYRNGGLEVPKLDDAIAAARSTSPVAESKARAILKILIDSGELAKVTDEFYFSRAALDDLTGKVRQFATGSDNRLIDVAQFKDLAGVSRKYAIPLLEYFDREKITARSGDKRIIL